MPITEHPMHALAAYLPDGSFEQVVDYLHRYRVHLTVTKQRKSVLGDYRHAGMGRNHRISINGNLNPFEFLITLLHELAHLLTFEQHGNRVESHGKEWKNWYSHLLLTFMQHKIFPADIETALQASVLNPAATANGETELLLVLRKYNPVQKEGHVHVADLPGGALFMMDNGKIFRKGPIRRKRFDCEEIKTGLHYSVSPVIEVKMIKEE